MFSYMSALTEIEKTLNDATRGTSATDQRIYREVSIRSVYLYLCVCRKGRENFICLAYVWYVSYIVDRKNKFL